MARIAGRAGVTVQTFYLAWGSKRDVLRACLTDALSGGADPGEFFRERLDAMALVDARAVVDGIARLSADIALRASSAWALYRQAAATDPDIAADWRELQRLRRGTIGAVVARIPSNERRKGVDEQQAADTAWAIASPETYDLFVNHLGRTLDEYHSWLRLTLRSTLLSTPTNGHIHPPRSPRAVSTRNDPTPDERR